MSNSYRLGSLWWLVHLSRFSSLYITVLNRQNSNYIPHNHFYSGTTLILRNTLYYVNEVFSEKVQFPFFLGRSAFVRKHCFFLIMCVNQDTLLPALMGDLSFSCAACITGVIVSRRTPSFPAARACLVLVSYIALCLAIAGLKNAKK